MRKSEQSLSLLAGLLVVWLAIGCGNDLWQVVHEPGALWATQSSQALEDGKCREALRILDSVSSPDRTGTWYELFAISSRSCYLETARPELREQGLSAMADGERRFPHDPMIKYWHGCLLEAVGSTDAHRKLLEARQTAVDVVRQNLDREAAGVGRKVLRMLNESRELRVES